MVGTLLFVYDAIVGYIIFPILIVNAVASWLIAFEIVPRYKRSVVHQIYDITNGFVRPLVAPFRRIVPPIGGLDLSPMIFIIALLAIGRLLHYFLDPIAI